MEYEGSKNTRSKTKPTCSQETGDQSSSNTLAVGLNTPTIDVNSISNSNSGNSNALSRAMSTKMVKVETGHGVLPEDVILARRLKNPVEFALNYMKVWCKSCKEVTVNLDRRGASEIESCRTTAKYLQAIESALASSNGVPMKTETAEMAHCLLDQCKEVELQNQKLCRGLLEVLHRQHMSVEKARKHLKDQWKAELKRMVDAENSLIKTKSVYYRSCQTGVKLREDLASAQNLLDDYASTVNVLAGHNQTQASPGLSGLGQTSSTSGVLGAAAAVTQVATVPSVGTATTPIQSVSSQMNLAGDSIEPVQSATENAALGQAVNQVSKQKVKVERLEKQLSDNDKKEFEQMYAYRETVETANLRLHELEKRKMEILCDVRLTITKSDEVVKNTLAEYFSQLYSTRIQMIQKYSDIAEAFQNYIPCAAYLGLSQEVIQTEVDTFPEKYQFIGFHEAGASGLKVDLSGRGGSRNQPSPRETDCDSAISARSGLLVHSDSDSDGEGETPGAGGSTASHLSRYTSSVGSSNVLSSIVEFSSNLFRPDSKKSLRGKRPASSAAALAAAAAAANQTSAELEAAQLANIEKEYVVACRLLARCVAAIEQQSGGLDTHGIYRVPASKVKVSGLLEYLQSHQPTNRHQVTEDLANLVQEQPMTLAGLIKAQLIALPEPLLTYNLYQQFVDLGKAADSADSSAHDELVRRLQDLIGQLLPANRQLAGLIFHHLHRVSLRQSENQMNSANLGCMFGPTVLRQRPKFQVANMMEFVDNKGQIKITEVMIDYVTKIFGPASQFNPVELITDESNHGNTGKGNQSENQGRTPVSSSIPTVGVDSSPGSLKLRGLKDGTTSPATGTSILRSATISANSTTKTGYLGSSMPLYTPYGTQSTNSAKTTPESVKSMASQTPTTPTTTTTDSRSQTGRRGTGTTGGSVPGGPSIGGGEPGGTAGALSTLMVGLRIPATRLALSTSGVGVGDQLTKRTNAGASTSGDSGPLNSNEYSYIDTDPADP